MAGENVMGGEDDDVQFMRTVNSMLLLSIELNIVDSFFKEDHLCLSCVPVSGVKRMALSGEVFGNRMSYLEDISNEVRKMLCCEIDAQTNDRRSAVLIWPHVFLCSNKPFLFEPCKKWSIQLHPNRYRTYAR
jgi:hypothetical protein